MEQTRTRTKACLFLLLLVLACNEDSEITSGIDGKWQGTLAEIQVKPFGLPLPISQDDPSFETRIDFSDNGVMVIWDGSDPKEGTYKVEGNELTTDIDYSIEDISLSGTYIIETLTATQLVIHLERDETIADPDGGPSISGKIKVTLHFNRL
jgi:hypothetical protein